MLLGSINFSVSDTTRKRVQQQMLPEAIRELQDTALIAAHALGKTRARVQALTIGNEGNAPRPMMMMATRSAPMDKVATPDWQAGKTQLQIQVSGKLELD